MNYMDESVVCPFYAEGETVRIRCEGYCKGTHLHISFDCKERLKLHKKKYCDRLDGYKSCPIYPVIMKQYESKEDDDE